MTIHLVVTPFCNRNCKYCCNKKYDIQNLPIVTDEELKNADMLCLTGGEPFAYTNPVAIAKHYHAINPDIPIIVYTNAWELFSWLTDTVLGRSNGMKLVFKRHLRESGIVGLNICIKSVSDMNALYTMILGSTFTSDGIFGEFTHNRLIVMEEFWDDYYDGFELGHADNLNPSIMKRQNFTNVIKRPWQKDFQPAPKCLFRRI